MQSHKPRLVLFFLRKSMRTKYRGHPARVSKHSPELSYRDYLRGQDAHYTQYPFQAKIPPRLRLMSSCARCVTGWKTRAPFFSAMAVVKRRDRGFGVADSPRSMRGRHGLGCAQGGRSTRRVFCWPDPPPIHIAPIRPTRAQ